MADILTAGISSETYDMIPPPKQFLCNLYRVARLSVVNCCVGYE